MKILFVPMPEGGLSHLIPLLALKSMIETSSIQSAFLASKSLHPFLKNAQANVLHIDHKSVKENGFRTEMQAYGIYQPDVVIDDTSLTTGIATTLSGIPRITIQRTGIFAGYKPRFPHYRHSMGVTLDKIPNISFPGLPKPQELGDLFKASIKIVPGVPSVEILPRHLQQDPSYIFAGPLVMNDYLFESKERQANSLETFFTTDNFEGPSSLERLDSFFHKQRGRTLIYITLGTIAQAHEIIPECIKLILNLDISVVSSIPVKDLSTDQQNRFYFAPYLPMHYVCQHADLMIHHCGSGTYQYALLHQVPSITIGTMCFDRDDVALRLEELGVSTHIPAPLETNNFLSIFKELIEAHFNGSNTLMGEKRKNLKILSQEIESVKSQFDLENILKTLFSRTSLPQGKPASPSKR